MKKTCEKWKSIFARLFDYWVNLDITERVDCGNFAPYHTLL